MSNITAGTTRTRRAWMALLGLAIAVAATVPGLAPTAAHALPPNPSVTGPTENGLRANPWNASTFPLETDDYEYREDEFFFSGTAEDLSDNSTAAYTSRYIIRQPADPADFNGIVLVDWMNVTNGQDWEYNWWPTAYDYLMREGYATVGVSAQLVGVAHLQTWDPPRYGTLNHPGSKYDKDIFAQAMQSLKHGADNIAGVDGVVDPLFGRTVDFLIGGGVSQSASNLISFIDNGYNRGVVDAWNIERALGNTPTDLSTFVFILNEETDFTGRPTGEQQADSAGLRVWEEAGIAHHPIEWWDYTFAGMQRDQGVPGLADPVDGGCSVNRGTMGYSVRAMLHHTKVYLDSGNTTLPPAAPRIPRNGDGTLPRDENGLVEGGLRHPFIEVPIALNRATEDDCINWGLYEAWDNEKIRGLYPTHADYVAQTTTYANSQVLAGLLLGEDRDDAIARAVAFVEPWDDVAAPDPDDADGGADDDATDGATDADDGAGGSLAATGGGSMLAAALLGLSGVTMRRRRRTEG